MKIMDYLTNPVGKGSAFYPVKEMISKHNAKYELQKNGIGYKIYTFRGMIYYHMTIPSSEDNIMYDVLVEFRRTTRSTDKSILDMPFRVFSNCPSFVFTYAYAYNKQHIVIDTLQRAATRKAIQDKATIRNKYNVVGFEYSVYLALKHIVVNNLHSMAHINATSEKVILIDSLYRKMQDFDSLMLRRKAADKNRRANQKEEGRKVRKENKARKSNRLNTQDVDTVGEIKQVRQVRRTTSTKTVKRAKTAKKK